MGVINGQERFDANVSTLTHSICHDCGSVIDIEETFGNFEAEKQVSNKYGLPLRNKKLFFMVFVISVKLGIRP